MRLSQEQRQDIRSTIERFMGNSIGEIYLYGSRTQDHLKGGDIDLLIVTKTDTDDAPNEYLMLNEIKKNKSIGDQRIDLKIAKPQELKSDPFLLSILDSLLVI